MKLIFTLLLLFTFSEVHAAAAAASSGAGDVLTKEYDGQTLRFRIATEGDIDRMNEIHKASNQVSSEFLIFKGCSADFLRGCADLHSTHTVPRTVLQYYVMEIQEGSEFKIIGTQHFGRPTLLEELYPCFIYPLRLKEGPAYTSSSMRVLDPEYRGKGLGRILHGFSFEKSKSDFLRPCLDGIYVGPVFIVNVNNWASRKSLDSGLSFISPTYGEDQKSGICVNLIFGVCEDVADRVAKIKGIPSAEEGSESVYDELVELIKQNTEEANEKIIMMASRLSFSFRRSKLAKQDG
tara:strand:- start:61890 stop:62768 length:879 start_codon:yes stop_codon:yes gene_type:complete